MPNLSFAGCLGARLESVMKDARQTPGEYSANSGPARLVPGPELSNESKDMQKKLYCWVLISTIILRFISCLQLSSCQNKNLIVDGKANFMPKISLIG